MSKVRRIYVEKKPSYAVAAEELLDNIKNYLGIKNVQSVRLFNRYDIENLSDETFNTAKTTVFSEPPVDILYEEELPADVCGICFGVEYLPGQFDQRADSAEQCVKLLAENENPVIRFATVYAIEGDLSAEEIESIRSFCINPVDSRACAMEKHETLVMRYDEPCDVLVLDDFITMSETDLNMLYDSLNLAMTFEDFKFIRDYFKTEEMRDPTMTEIRVLDTYWSDHCRHTTFLTELKNIEFEDGFYRKPIEHTFEMYKAHHQEIFAGRKDKYISLMDIALMAMRKLKADGKLEDMEESDEINACSIVVPVEIDGTSQEWLVSFKNETHNHPTEIEPFGGAATCLGGAIRDPLSGRSYVYQAMRVTGAADPTVPLWATLKGKLPQRKIVTGAARGYSAYGNQIGLATGLVSEVYHPDFVAKRLEIGAVIGAAPRENVIRKNSEPGDKIILLGGRTGRDGCGGATGSSKAHTIQSLDTCGAEVQKGNAPTERKLQRLFRKEKVSRLIKKCNDFGAGGVSVAIGELADGLRIDMDKVPKKYAGLDGTELAISESQERMAVVVDEKDVDEFLNYAAEENLEAVCVATVTDVPRLVMLWRGQEIVNISRAFLNTNGAHQEADVYVSMPAVKDNFFENDTDYPAYASKTDDRISLEHLKEFRENKENIEGAEAKTKTADINLKQRWLGLLADLNVCSQKGLVEMFDSSIGAGSVCMPYGGKYQLTPMQTMIGKLPLLQGKTDTVTMMSYGYDPYLSSWSPFHGAVYAVVDSVAKIVASGGDHSKIRFTFQEYFKRLGADKKRWGQPMSALLGAYHAQMGFGLPSIGGKDSMSGTFNDIDVPPTLVSFAVDVADGRQIITPELKHAGNKIVLFPVIKDAYDLPDYDQLKIQYEKIYQMIRDGVILSAYAIGRGGVAGALSKMAFGNGLGVHFSDGFSEDMLFKADYGSIIAEMPKDVYERIIAEASKEGCTQLNGGYIVAEVWDKAEFVYKNTQISLEEAKNAWAQPLEKVYPVSSNVRQMAVPDTLFNTKNIYVCRHKIARPTVFVPVFPGTNCEYDTMKAFEAAGADVCSVVFKNMTAENIRDSVDAFEKTIGQSQILMFPGGFSAGDEPDGSGKFIAAVFRNERIKEAVNKMLYERDGLALGICNGFQALIKLGLVPYGQIVPQQPDSPTLTVNHIGRHVSKMVYTKVVSNKSPWFSNVSVGDVFAIPASHGEGRFVASDQWIQKLFETGCVATQYVDLDGTPTMDENYNINGSYAAIEGITSPDGRILGKMAHSERIGQHVAKNIYGSQDQKIFESGVAYFK